jgi:hypothetical protein
VREVLCLLRAGLPPAAYGTPIQTLEHARLLRDHGVGYHAAVIAYAHAAAMLRAVFSFEVDEFVLSAVERLRGSLATEYELDSRSAGGDVTIDDPASIEAAERFRDQELEWPEGSCTRAECERAFDAFARAPSATARATRSSVGG